MFNDDAWHISSMFTCSLVHFKCCSFFKCFINIYKFPLNVRKYTSITDLRVAGAWVHTTTGQSHCGPNSLSSWSLLPLLPPGEDSAGARPHQTAGHVIGKIPCVRWLPTHTQTCVPDFAARWKMRKCARHRPKYWIQTKISTKDQHLLKVICKTSARLVIF